jgi:hypothetical protein
MNPNLVTVYKSPFPKKRIGRWTDGGYVIADIPDIKYNVLFAGGVCDDISFEEDFIRFQNNPDMPVYAFDGTVDGLPRSPFDNQIKFIKKNIGFSETADCTNLSDLFSQYANPADPKIFVKMDIEGGEVDWIRSISEDHMNSIAQFVMEFHTPYSEKEIETFTKINKTHILVHFHPNNAPGTRIHNGVYFPNVFECTYLHKRFFGGKAELNMDPIPNDAVDVRNIHWNPEIYMGHPPFVHAERFVREL